MSGTSGPVARGLVPLADRVRWSTWLRLGLVAVVVVAWCLLPQDRSGDPRVFVVAAAAYATASLLVTVAPHLGRLVTLWTVALGTALDCLFLALAFHGLGGLQGPVVVCFAVHASALCLLHSFRAGVRAALGHSLLVLVVVQGTSTGAFPSHEFTVFLLQLWLATVATSSFAAVNERELRRRRYDAEVVNRFLTDLEGVVETADVADRLAEFCGRELLVRRAVVLHGVEEGAHRVVGWSAGGLEDGTIRPGWVARSRVLGMASRSDGPLLVRRVDEDVLAPLLPAADGVVVLPLRSGSVSGDGWLLLDLGSRRAAGVERRLLSTAGQAAAHTALALSRARAVETLRRAAQSDGLTGVHNRRWFDEAFPREIAVARAGGRGLAVALVDLDHFKAVNDVHGHQAGDDVLVRAAAALRAAGRSTDRVARYGGEEFAVLLPGTGAEEALEVVERLRRAVAGSAGAVAVTCSIGVAPFDGLTATSPEALLGAADQALYRAKAEGRDRCVLAGPTRPGTVQAGTVQAGTAQAGTAAANSGTAFSSA